MENIIEIKDLSFNYGGADILQNISLNVEAGEFLGLVGPNAGGKSTLLKIILGLLKPSSGHVRLFGLPAAEGRKRIGYCPQYAEFSRNYPITVEELVLMGRLGRTKLFGGYTKNDRQIAQEAMQATEVEKIQQENLYTLSGGQLQRAMIARALASKPEVLILDEPTANIDQRVEVDIFQLLKQLNSRMTIIVVSHDIGFISEYVDRVACLNRTLICHKTSELTGENIEELYGSHVHMIEHHH